MIFSTLINISLFFIFVITFGYNCLRNFVVKKKINNINKNDKNKYLYYRELLKELSIEELGYLFNGKKDVNLYIAVSLIKLKKINNVQLYNDDKNLKVLVENNLFKKGYIKELNYDKYLKEILSKKDITASEKFILSNLKNIDKDYFKKEYISIIEKNLNLKGYIEKYESTKMELFSISLGVISFIIYFISVLINNGDNDICDSARGESEHGGLSDFGREVVSEMNRTGMIVDLSHASEKTFYDTLEESAVPVVCSHSSCRALCDHPRNLTDEQMKELARRGGVMQVCLYGGFLRKDAPATILDAVEHLNHMVNMMGIDHVGIGTDFDGDGGICGCASASELINFTRRLLSERYSESDIRKIWGGNFLRVMEEVQKRGDVRFVERV